MELWDAYNSNFETIEGLTLVRGQEDKIPSGVYHLVCHVLVRHKDGTYLLMQRDPRKPYPNMWEASAGGSALKGESPLQGALRELREETGIEAESLELLDQSFLGNCIHCRFLCQTDCDKKSVRLQEGETVNFHWASAEEILSLSEEELISWPMRKHIK
ncbi:MAG: NUDIX domain-containing protein [Treponemataceae bacterium]|nr:NUDIX domain-containing protein [Treponemataceae bacterium]